MRPICFYNLAHTGDVYAFAIFINELCKANPDSNFLYYTINGSIFFDNIANIKRISPLEKEYINPLVNGTTADKYIDRCVLDVLYADHLLSGSVVKNFKTTKILFINTWIGSDYIKSNEDFCFKKTIASYNQMIDIVNNKYNTGLNNINPTPRNILDFINNINYKKIVVNPEDFKDSIFIFNYVPMSLYFDMNKLYNYVIEISKTNKIILASHNAVFDNNNNITFVDKTYGIYPVPSAENLLQVWDIASECKKVIILPTGSSWFFFHKLDKLEKEKLFIFNHDAYVDRLNGNIAFLTEVGNPVISKICY